MTRPGKFICAGGSGSNEARIFDTSKGNALVGVVKGFEKAVYTSHFSPCGNKVALAGGDSKIHTFSISERRFDSSKMDLKNTLKHLLLQILENLLFTSTCQKNIQNCGNLDSPESHCQYQARSHRCHDCNPHKRSPL